MPPSSLLQATGKLKKKPSILKKDKVKAAAFGCSKIVRDLKAMALASLKGSSEPPLPPPADPPPETGVAACESAHSLFGLRVRICSDRHGRVSCGVEGVVVRVRNDRVHLKTDTHALHDVPVSVVYKCSLLQPPCRLKNLRQVSAIHRGAWLVECGWNEHFAGEDTFKSCAEHLAGEAPVMIGHHHLRLYWRLLQWALPLETAPRKVVYLDPELLWSWHGGVTESEDPEDLKKQFAVILRQCSEFAGALVLIPIWKSEHWTLLVLDHLERTCRYYDSLLGQMEATHLVADFLLAELKKTGRPDLQWLPEVCPDRRNGSRQDRLQCGFFVGWWLEEECRYMLGEGWCSRGWPDALQVRGATGRFMANLLPAAEKMQHDLELIEGLEAEAAKAHDQAAAEAKAGGVLGDAAKTLQEKALADLAACEQGAPVEIHLEDPGALEPWAEEMMALLLPAHRADVLRVKATGLGVCGSCRWRSGCRSCSWPKTVRYWRNKEVRGKFLEAYMPAAKASAKAAALPAAAKPKPKAKGKAKAKAAGKMLGGGPSSVIQSKT